MSEKARLAPEELSALVDDGQRQKLRMLLNEEHPADIAEWLADLDNSHRLSCFRLLDLDNASAVLAELEPETQGNLLKDLGDIGVVPIIARMSPDDAADLLAELPKEKVQQIINQMTDTEAKEDIQELMGFEEDSAGGIMSTDYLAVEGKLTADQAISYLRETYAELEDDIYDVYVVSEEEKLAGRVTLKELLMAPPEALVESLMDDNVIKVLTTTDQEEAAEKLSRYDLLTLPVVDEEGKLRGIITADDVIDVLWEESTEDLFQASGISTEAGDLGEQLSLSVRRAVGARLPWLLITLGIEAGSVSVITHFDNVIKETVAAASFMPLLSGVTGSVATQSTCITLRGTGMEKLAWRVIVKHIFHEARVGMLLGILCGGATTLMSWMFHSVNPTLGFVVGCSLFVTMTCGVLIGTLMPMVFQKLGIDPAHASGPFITSILDVCTMTIYLTIVHQFLLYTNIGVVK
ncbi:MAG TPA: magnesium transporter [Candidatus Melainabacteria bacterium]|nr:magnesium transporter [Candidatus Melainabacteria bacterium]